MDRARMLDFVTYYTMKIKMKFIKDNYLKMFSKLL